MYLCTAGQLLEVMGVQVVSDRWCLALCTHYLCVVSDCDESTSSDS